MSLSIKQKLNNNNGEINTIKSDVLSLRAEVAESIRFHHEVADGNIQIDTLITNVNNNASLISGIQSDVASQSSAITTIQSDVATNASGIVAFNSQFTGEITRVEGLITAEESARGVAESSLQSNIDAEASTRLANDNTLQSNLDTESATRLANDNTLQANLDAESGTRLANDNTLQSNIDTEAAARAAGDLTNSNAITAEIGARQTAISETQALITSQIAVETAQRNVAINSASESLQANIDAEASTRLNNDNTLQSNITAEATARSAADTTLQSNIDTKEDIVVLYQYPTIFGTIFPQLERDDTNKYLVHGANKYNVHLEAEGLVLNEFGFCTGTGAPSSQNFGIYTPDAWLTHGYYSVCKYDSSGNEILSGSGSVKLQLYLDGVAKDCFIEYSFGDLSVITNRRKPSYFKTGAGQSLVNVSTTATNASNYVNGLWAFKCVEITGFDSNTRHRFNVQYENRL